MIKRHSPAFLNCVDKYLDIKENGIYIDCTFGCGGFSLKILNKLNSRGRLFSFDLDPESFLIGKKIVDKRFTIINDNFSNMKKYISNYSLLKKVNGIVFDLGISSHQLDNPKRGFSFLRKGPLDMRMNQNLGISARKWINYASKNEIYRVIRNFGEEYRYSFKIANIIVKNRIFNPIKTTTDLSKIIKSVIKRKKIFKYQAKIFQSIRIFINNELYMLSKGLNEAYDLLSSQGRLVVISFHSLEDRIVKNFIRSKSNINNLLLPGVPLNNDQIKVLYPIKMYNIGKFKPSIKEIKDNNRIRSAILRVAVKI